MFLKVFFVEIICSPTRLKKDFSPKLGVPNISSKMLLFSSLVLDVNIHNCYSKPVKLPKDITQVLKKKKSSNSIEHIYRNKQKLGTKNGLITENSKNASKF